MLARLESLVKRHSELELLLSDPEVVGDRAKYQEYTRAFAELAPIVEGYNEFRRLEQELGDARTMSREEDDELAKMARQEVASLEARRGKLETELKLLLIPKDPNDDKSVILEVRAGTGGDEATLFAQEIVRMYTRYAEGRGWKVDLLSSSVSGAGGIKEAIFEVQGKGAYSRLKHESGVHRVQRVPRTEASGRIHTSAVTVAVLPEADEVEVKIDEKDLRIDTFCASGPGGQSVNTTYSAVRITHLSTGIVVSQQDEKSWHKNKAKAMRVLRSRVYDRMLQEQQSEIAQERRTMVGTGDRAEKIRTYNFPQNRVSDHRIGLTTHQLTEILDGRLDELIDPLVSFHQAERLREEVGG